MTVVACGGRMHRELPGTHFATSLYMCVLVLHPTAVQTPASSARLAPFSAAEPLKCTAALALLLFKAQMRTLFWDLPAWQLLGRHRLRPGSAAAFGTRPPATPNCSTSGVCLGHQPAQSHTRWCSAHCTSQQCPTCWITACRVFQSCPAVSCWRWPGQRAGCCA